MFWERFLTTALAGGRRQHRGVHARRPSSAAVAVAVAVVALCVFAGAAHAEIELLEGEAPAPSFSWEPRFAYWRDNEKVSFDEWWKDIPRPVPAMDLDEWSKMDNEAQNELFDQCLIKEAQDLSHHVLRYRSPELSQVRARVDELLKARGAHVVVSIFWGRERYVNILWPYLERNLRVNKGIVDKIILITKPRDSEEGNAGARAILERAIKQYPGIVEEVPFCPKAYGCAFDEIMVDPNAVYVKMDDDIVFIKDGSVEHLVLQTLANKDYSVYTASVVNNPHGYGVHHFVGAYPPETWHHRGTRSFQHPPFVNSSEVVLLYYGKNVYDGVGSAAHEAFIYNIAHNRLDVYTFDMWDMNRCRCARPQEGLDMCSEHGKYRWSINAISWLYNMSSTYEKPVPAFDEPTISMSWTSLGPKRAGMVGEALFVHCQYTRQRNSRPDFGLREDILLPWYTELMEQYMATDYDSWKGNHTLFDLYIHYNWLGGERQFSRSPTSPRGELPPYAGQYR